ncbi:MAG: helicase C-terminal domain-containing protein [Candidatus Nitrosocaldaceae archaeon]
MLVDELKRLFPFPTYRKYQEQVLTKIAEHLSTGVRCIFLDAPVGFGKSAINVTLCRYYWSYYTTPQLQLVTQLERDPILSQYLTVIRGRSNYICSLLPDGSTVDIGLCVRVPDTNCDKYNICPYYIRKKLAIESQAVLTTTQYLAIEGYNPVFDSLYNGNENKSREESMFQERDLLIVDECHTLPSVLLSQLSLTLTSELLDELGMDLLVDESEIMNWLVELKNNIVDYIDAHKQMTLDNQVIIATEMTRRLVQMQQILYTVSIYINCNIMPIVDIKYLSISNSGNGSNNGDNNNSSSNNNRSNSTNKKFIIILRPYSVRNFVSAMLWRRSEIVVLSSATIIPELLIRETGIDIEPKFQQHTARISVPSNIPVSNRPIILMTEYDMSFENRDKELIRVLPQLKLIFDKYLSDNILVHVSSYKIAEDLILLYKQFYNDTSRFIIGRTEEELNKFLNSRGKIYVSPSAHEGLDLYDDRCRCQVLLKLPFPDIKDKWVSVHLQNKEWFWYNMSTLLKVIQAYGRAVRHERDYAVFYILDKSFNRLIKSYRKYLPSFFLEALPDYTDGSQGSYGRYC